MSGAHARTDPPSRPGLAVGVLALLGLAPPAAILAPQIADTRSAPAPVSRPDVLPAEPAALAVLDRPHGHTCRCGVRP